MDSVSSAWDNGENTARDLMSYTITKIFKISSISKLHVGIFFLKSRR